MYNKNIIYIIILIIKRERLKRCLEDKMKNIEPKKMIKEKWLCKYCSLYIFNIILIILMDVERFAFFFILFFEIKI